jgi:hypothetical protein
VLCARLFPHQLPVPSAVYASLGRLEPRIPPESMFLPVWLRGRARPPTNHHARPAAPVVDIAELAIRGGWTHTWGTHIVRVSGKARSVAGSGRRAKPTGGPVKDDGLAVTQVKIGGLLRDRRRGGSAARYSLLAGAPALSGPPHWWYNSVVTSKGPRSLARITGRVSYVRGFCRPR